MPRIESNHTYWVDSSYDLDNLTSKLEKNQKAVVTRMADKTYAINVVPKPSGIASLIAKLSGQEKRELRSLRDFRASLVLNDSKQLNAKYPNIQKRWESATREEKIGLREEVIKYTIESNPKLKAKFADHPEKFNELVSRIRPEVDVDHNFNGTLDIVNNHLRKLAKSGNL